MIIWNVSYVNALITTIYEHFKHWIVDFVLLSGIIDTFRVVYNQSLSN